MRAALVLVLTLAAAPARAEDAGDPAGPLDRPLLLAPGELEARVAVEASLARGAVLDPVAIAPDLWIGVNRRLTLGVTHGHAARRAVGSARGLCVAGGCDPRWAGAIDARFRLGAERIGRIALDARRWAPAVVALELGVTWRWRRGDVAVGVAPTVAIGLHRRDLANRERADVPVTVAWRVHPRVALEAGTGPRGPVDDFFAAFELPVRAGVAVAARTGLDVGVAAGLDDPFRAGPAARHAAVWAAWRR